MGRNALKTNISCHIPTHRKDRNQTSTWCEQSELKFSHFCWFQYFWEKKWIFLPISAQKRCNCIPSKVGPNSTWVNVLFWKHLVWFPTSLSGPKCHFWPSKNSNFWLKEKWISALPHARNRNFGPTILDLKTFQKMLQIINLQPFHISHSLKVTLTPN